MIYIAVTILLWAVAIISKAKNQKRILVIETVCLCVFFSLRFGQGTDYINYNYIFRAAPLTYSGFFRKSYNYLVEPLYWLINIFAKRHHLGFPFVVACVAAITLFFVFLSAWKFSDWPSLAIFILFCNYFSYLTNLYRWGAAASIALFAICSYVDDKKITKFLLLVFLAMMFHTSAFVIIIVPVLLKFKLDFHSISKYVIMAMICFAASFFVFPIVIRIASLVNSHYSIYKDSVHYGNIIPCMVRMVFAIFVLYFYKRYNDKFSNQTKSLIEIYLFGSLLFILLSSADQAARITDYFTMIEIIVISNIFASLPANYRRSNTMFIALCLCFFIMLNKELVTLEIQGHYPSKNPLNYPYVTIFHKEEILNYMPDVDKSFLN